MRPRPDFGIFWRGVAGWPWAGRKTERGLSAARYLLARGGLVPDFRVDSEGRICLSACRPVPVPVSTAAALQPALSQEREMQCSSGLSVQKSWNEALAILEASE
jgi:hypothetical protein